MELARHPAAPEKNPRSRSQRGRPADALPEEGARQAFERLRSAAGSGEQFRFISEPRRGAYLAILHALHRRRIAHEMEVYHDDLRDEVAGLLQVEPGRELAPGRDSGLDLDPQQFRSDVEQLRRWGNVTERIEPTRIRSLADRGRSKLLLRLEPGTAAFLHFLEGLADPLPLGLRDQGANLLADVHENLKEAVRSLKQARERMDDAGRELDGDPAHDERRERMSESDAEQAGAVTDPRADFEQAVLRASHLIHEADAKTGRVAAELVEFEDRLTRFVIEPFRIADVVALGNWLEHYLDRYLSLLDERGLPIRRVLGQLAGERLGPLLGVAEDLERRQLAETPGLAETPVRLRAASETVAALRRFFDPHHGLAEICRRINRRTRDAIRRIQRHVEALRLRNVRTEAIRARTVELMALPVGRDSDRRAVAFLSELIAAVGARSDGRAGTPERRAAPPRPNRRYESSRRDYRGDPLPAKRGQPGQRRELERLRLERLSRFVETRLLRGRPAARLTETQLESSEDSKTLVQALAAYLLAEGRHRRYLSYRLERAAPGERGCIEAVDHVLDLPDARVARCAGRPATARSDAPTAEPKPEETTA